MLNERQKDLLSHLESDHNIYIINDYSSISLYSKRANGHLSLLDNNDGNGFIDFESALFNAINSVSYDKDHNCWKI